MKRKVDVLVACLALTALLLISACGNNNANTNTSSPSVAPTGNATATAPAAGGGATTNVTVNAVNWAFDVTEIRAKQGDTLKLTLNNSNGVHGLAIKDLDVNLKNGETVDVKLDKAGTYEYYCSIQCGQGHDNMVGQLIVE